MSEDLPKARTLLKKEEGEEAHPQSQFLQCQQIRAEQQCTEPDTAEQRQDTRFVMVFFSRGHIEKYFEQQFVDCDTMDSLLCFRFSELGTRERRNLGSRREIKLGVKVNMVVVAELRSKVRRERVGGKRIDTQHFTGSRSLSQMARSRWKQTYGNERTAESVGTVDKEVDNDDRYMRRECWRSANERHEPYGPDSENGSEVLYRDVGATTNKDIL